MKGVLAGRERVFRAVTRVVVPESVTLTAEEWKSALQTVESALADRPPALRRPLRLFLAILEHGARLRCGRRLSMLPRDDAARYLRTFETSPIALFRRGFWGVRTLALMGYYARPAGPASVGYRAHPGGWNARQVLP